MRLIDWQLKLDSQYSQLKQNRSLEGTQLPVFAIEHGLSPLELVELQSDIKKSIQERSPDPNNWLPWIVYAAEIGYGYSGHEYWPVFEDATPGWSDRGDRNWIRSIYQRFRTDYGGYNPQGIWASHFSIICWPIFHAILPKDLQGQLAYILNDISADFELEDIINPAQLGEFIHSQSYTASKRFRQFSEETLLVGEIASSLLGGGEVAANSSLIEEKALSRITADLTNEQESRIWLETAKRRARQVQVRGLGSGRSGMGSARPRATRSDRDPPTKVDVSFELLERVSANWDLFAIYPDIRGIAVNYPLIVETLMGSKAKPFEESTVLARGRLLGGAEVVPLSIWPTPGQQPVTLYPTEPVVEQLYSTARFMSESPSWLFEIRDEGRASHILTRKVAPGHSYLIASRDLWSPNSMIPGVYTQTASCDGIHITKIDVTASIDAELELQLQRFGIQFESRIDVAPVGVPPVSWDTTGDSKYIDGDVPTFRISFNLPLSLLTVEVDDNIVESSDHPEGSEMLVAFQDLTVGRHVVRITMVPNDNTVKTIVGELRIRIERPRGRSSLLSSRPIQLMAEVPSPSLEDLWDGRAGIFAAVPKGHQVKVTAQMTSNRHQTSILEKPLAPLNGVGQLLDMEEYLDAHLRSDEEFQVFYDSANLCTLRLDGGRLGTVTTVYEREFSPLRWAVVRVDGTPKLRLIDQTAVFESTNITFTPFDRPYVLDGIQYENFTQASDWNDTGGLYKAINGRFTDAIIVAPSDSALHHTSEDQAPILNGNMSLAQAFVEWLAARMPGDEHARSMTRDLHRQMAIELFTSICGAEWEAVEKLYLDGSKDATDVIDSASGFLNYEFQNMLDSEKDKLASISVSSRLLGFMWSSAIDLDATKQEAEFALRIATDIGSCIEWSGSEFENSVSQLKEQPELSRRARLFGLAIAAVDAHRRRNVKLPGWVW